MGLERHIEDVLEKNGVGRTTYYFEFGLKTDSEFVARNIAEILNESGEFAPAEAFFQGGLDAWGIRFNGIYKKGVQA